MNTKRLLQPQVLIAILLVLILVGVVLVANGSSDGPNSGVLSVEAIGIAITQKGTCPEIAPTLEALA
jgi:preprotein translocase subunit SecG